MKHICALAVLLSGLAIGTARAGEDVMIVFDGSNSMWGRIDGEPKIDIARRAMDRLLGDWTKDANLGLMAYGHRRAGDCSDIETLIDPAKGTRGDIRARIDAITPRGKTPLTTAIEQAAETLSYRDNPATVVLISDGIESCQRDPCALADTLEKSGVGFTAHVVGFGLDDAEASSLSCIAENTGGRFVAASDSAELGAALGEVSDAVAEAAQTPPEPVSVDLDAPETAQAGTDFEIRWSQTPDPSDRIVMVSAGGAIDAAVASVEAGDATSAVLTAPAQSGQYELHYILADSGDVAGSDSMVVSGPEIEVSAPESAPAGSKVKITWSESLHNRDLVTIVPADADEGAHREYDRVDNDTATTLTLPGDPGLYEARYVQNADGKTLGAAPIEATEPEVSISGPGSAETGSHVTVKWSKGINDRDYVTIVPTGADEGTHTGYERVDDDSSATLTAPADPGLYEMRYVLNAGGRTLASAPLEVTEPKVTISGPETATTGSKITVEWSKGINDRDYVTIVPTGADEGTHTGYERVDNDSSATLTAPADPGLYEMRYVLNAGGHTLASAPLEVTEPEVTISGPETAATGSRITVEWSESVNGRDYVTIVPTGADEGTHSGYERVDNDSSATLTAPADPGLYELRYVLNAGGRTLASAPLEVTEPSVTISGPESTAAGSRIEVSWSQNINGEDYVTIVPAGAEAGSHGDYERVKERSTAMLTAPADPGLYELRYLLNNGARTLATAPIEVTEPSVTVSGPESTVAGSRFEVSWSQNINGEDYVTIVPAGAEAGSHGDYERVKERSTAILTAPADPGLYELRYLLNNGARTLASAPIEVTEPEMSVSAPETIRVGDPLKVAWDGAVPDGEDYVTIVPLGTADTEHGNYERVKDDRSARLATPEAPGLYEVRYVLNVGDRVLARARVEIVSADTTLNQGGTLEAPNAGAPGETVEVSWSVATPNGRQRVTLARADQAAFTWIAAQAASEEPTLTFDLPSKAGNYEFRLLDLAEQKVLSRARIVVE